MRAYVTAFLVLAMLGASGPAFAQGPVNPRTPSGGGGGDRQAQPRGDSGGSSAPAPQRTPPSQSSPPSGARQAPGLRGQGNAGARTAVPRQGPPPSARRPNNQTVVVVPGTPAGAWYYYRGRRYPYYPYGTVGIFGSRPYWYPPHYGVTVQPYVRPTGRRYGELRLRIRPREAEVYVDGYYAGLVDNFDGRFQSLRLLPGPHHIEVVAPGYEVLEFDVGPVIGGKITYEGDLVPARF